MQEEKKRGYTWVIVVLSFLMVMVCLGFCSSPKSLFIVPVTKALGVTRSALAIGDSLRFITTAVINIFFGALISRFGAKKLILAGVLCLIASQLTYSFGENVYAFYVGGVLLGLGLSWTTTTMVGAVINRWCQEKKGTIMGTVLAANGVGGAIAIQILTPIIEAGVDGFRNAYRLAAAILLCLFLLLAIFFKDKKGDGATHKKKSRGRDWDGIAFSEAVHRPYFYGAAACIFLTGFVIQGVNGVSAAHMKDIGFSPSYVGTVLSIHSLSLAGFKFLTGYLYDKLGLRTTIGICTGTGVVVMLMLAFLTNSPAGRVLAMLYGIFSSLSIPLETIMLPIYAGDLFGQKSFNKILGIFVSVNTAGYALGAPAINWCYDRFGTYQGGFLLGAVIMAGILLSLQFVITAGHKEQKKAAGAKL